MRQQTDEPGATVRPLVRLKNRTDILNFLVRKNSYRRYLEIGVRVPAQNFDKVRVEQKHAVDPDPRGEISHVMTSDDFFSQLDFGTSYDLVLIDGLHLEEQVLRDVENALEHLSPGGAIVLHDCNPPAKENQREEYDGEAPWNGTVWKAVAKLRMTRADLSICVVDTDWGVGVITRGRQELFPEVPDSELTFELLDEHRRTLLNLVEPRAFPAVAKQMCAGAEAIAPSPSGLRRFLAAR
jgi:SAM-dependent methyltransferase